MDTSWISSCYRVIGESLLHPDERNTESLERRLKSLKRAPPSVQEGLAEFISSPSGRSSSEYVSTLELSPPCPLYLGAYLFEEPTTCRDVGMSGRNNFMLELTGIYQHFGFELSGGELPDYLPAVIEFAGVSFENAERDRIGLRRRFLEKNLRPGLDPLREKLEKFESPYVLLVQALQETVDADLSQMGDTKAWEPPAAEQQGEAQQTESVCCGDQSVSECGTR